MTPTFPKVPVLFSAGSWWVKGKLRVPKYQNRVSSIIADCGSFTLHSRFGGFPFSWGEYQEWLTTFDHEWFALWDKPRDPIATQKFINKYGDSGGIPTIQGKTLEEYKSHCKDLRDFPFLAVGGLVKNPQIRSILETIITELPDVSLHLWGVGLGVLKSLTPLPPNIVSADSSNWMGRWGSQLERYKEGYTQGFTQMEYAAQIMLPEYQLKLAKIRCS